MNGGDLYEQAKPGKLTSEAILDDRCTRIVRATGNEVLTAAKSFQRQAMGGSNERRQPFFGCSLDANAFSLISKEFYLIDEHFCGSEPVQPASLSH